MAPLQNVGIEYTRGLFIVFVAIFATIHHGTAEHLVRLSTTAPTIARTLVGLGYKDSQLLLARLTQEGIYRRLSNES